MNSASNMVVVTKKQKLLLTLRANLVHIQCSCSHVMREAQSQSHFARFQIAHEKQ